MTSAEYDKMISDEIEQQVIDNDILCKIDTETIIKHLLCVLGNYEKIHTDWEGNKYILTIDDLKESASEDDKGIHDEY